MTLASPTWDDIRAFLAAHGWREVFTRERGGRRQGHVFYEKVLENGRVLQTHVSHAGEKAISPGRFSSILRYQLEVSKEAFRDCVRTNRPADRPIELDEAPLEHEAWVVAVLVKDLHMSATEIETPTPDEARQMVFEYWSRRSGGA